MIDCPRCGLIVPAGIRYCDGCNTEVSDPTADTLPFSQMDPGDQLMVSLQQRLGGVYQLECVVGRGGMAIVYKATEVALERPVAIKVLPPDLARKRDTLERFKREARLAAALDHENIIPIHAIGEAGKLPFIVMKYVEGKALNEIIAEQGPLPIPVVLAVLRGTASALSFAHECAIVHRDIKGANILIEQSGRVLVADFGIARTLEDKTVTSSGTVVGTPTHMSPEQGTGRDVSPQSDQYSLGILGFEMLTGKVPFDAPSIVEILQHQYLTPLPDIRRVRDDIPAPLVALIERATNKRAADRFRWTDDMVAAIDRVPLPPDHDPRETTRMLKEMVAGVKLPPLVARPLPPLPNTGELMAGTPRTPLPHLPLQRRRSKRRPILTAMGGVVVITALALGVTNWSDLVGNRRGGNGAGNSPPPAASGMLDSSGLAEDLTESNATTTAEFAEGTPQGALPRDGTNAAPPPQEDAAAESSREQSSAEPSAPATTSPRREAVGTAFLRIRAMPTSAVIYVNGDSVGVGVVFNHGIPAGRAHVTITAPGFVDFDTTFVVSDHESVNMTSITLIEAGTQ